MCVSKQVEVAMDTAATPLVYNRTKTYRVALPVLISSDNLLMQDLVKYKNMWPYLGNQLYVVGDICDRTWEKGPLRALLQNRVIGIQG